MKSLTINKDNFFVVDGKTTTVKYEPPIMTRWPDYNSAVTKVVYNDLKNYGVSLDEVSATLRNHDAL